MNIIEIIETLRNFNEWRRFDGPIGEAPEQLSPKEIGEAIDGAVELLSKKSNTTIETIRAEVERRKNYLKPQGGQGLILCEEMRKQLDSLLSFLDTLQEQPVCEGLEMAVNSYLHHYEYPREEIDFYAFARHFYELGKQSECVKVKAESSIDRFILENCTHCTIEHCPGMRECYTSSNKQLQ